MKSSKDDLQSRGYIDQVYINQFKKINSTELFDLLNSNDSQERTVAAVLLGKRKTKKAVLPLCRRLEIEKKLYTKIALTEALSNIGIDSISELIILLGKIGKNQHRSLPKKPFNKKNYPLPRDIIARTIIKIGKPALPYLETVLKSDNEEQISEAIDAVGYISYYNNDLQSLHALNYCIKNHKSNDIIKWKIIRAFQSFPTESVIDYLENIVKHTEKKEFLWEAKRSLDQIKRRQLK